MKELTNKELMDIKGGATNYLSAAFITAITRAGNLLLDLGRSLGTSIRRVATGNVCPY